MHGRCRPALLVIAACLSLDLVSLLQEATSLRAEALAPPGPDLSTTWLIATASDSASRNPSSVGKTGGRAHSSSKRATASTGHSTARPRSTHRSIRIPSRSTGTRVRRYSNQNSLFRRWALAGLFTRPGFAEPRFLDAWNIRLVDGDTFWYGGERIRIRGYDAPERSEPGGFAATQRLDLLLHEGQVRITPQAVDRYGRTVADVYVDNRNVAEVMTAEGYVKKR